MRRTLLVTNDFPPAVGEFQSSLDEFTRRLPPHDLVVLASTPSREGRPWHDAMADVFAMPCRTRNGGLDVEGLGVVHLEASAAGLPVTSGVSGGAPETVHEGVTGLVVAGRNEDALVDAIVGLLRDPARRARMVRAGRDRMERDRTERDWAWPHLVERLVITLDAR